MRADIQDFLSRCRRPALVEYGDPTLPLLEGQYELEIRNRGLHICAWPAEVSFSRRIIALNSRKPGLMECTIQMFGGKTGRLSFLDLDHPKSAPRVMQGGRRNFGEAFRRMLGRQFPGWQVDRLSAEMDLSRSFSPVYPRAVLRKGNQNIAAMACPTAAEERGLLSFALLWHDYVSGRRENRNRVPLALFFPDGAGGLTALRLKWLNVGCRAFRFNDHGAAGEVDLADLGNLDTHLAPPKAELVLPPQVIALIVRLRRSFGIETTSDADGSVRLTCEGLAFARFTEQKIAYGIHDKQECTVDDLAEIEKLAMHLSEVRSRSAHRNHLLYRTQPERRLEALVRRNLGVVDATLEGQPVLGQVITFAAMDRDLIDLVSIGREGRLHVLELKADEDIHLPLQALDYWMRVRWHIYSGEFDSHFPDMTVQRFPPKLLLIAPSIRFHPSNATVLSYFSPEIETERIGVNLEWQQGLRVAFRLKGAGEPQSHGSGNERRGAITNPKSP
jgi:hypothetical protein